MDASDSASPYAGAAQAFDAHFGRTDGIRVVTALMAGFNTLSSMLLSRISTDVERQFGEDSMLMPVSALSGEQSTRREIEVFQAVESAHAVRLGGYLRDDLRYAEWFTQLRLGEGYLDPQVPQRYNLYRNKSPDGRRLLFESLLERTFPEAGRAPVVIYRLFPLAICIATALSFADHRGAEESRKQQLNLLPNLSDCRNCHGRLMENGDECRQCGNPFWKIDWLTAE